MLMNNTGYKKYRIKAILLSVCVIFIFNFFSCSKNSTAGGTTTQTTNGILAVLRTIDGEPVKNTLVKLRPRDYLFSAVENKDTVEYQNIHTDGEGAFKFYLTVNSPYKKSFLISSISNDSSQGIVIDSIEIESNDTYADTIWHDYSELKMKRTGSIYGLFRGIPSEEGTAIDTMILRFYGTDFQYAIIPHEKFEISGLPPFNYDIDISFKESRKKYAYNILIHQNTITYPKEEPFVDPFSFSGMKKIVFNTTQDGADVLDDVSPKFPLLIRLNSKNKEDSLIFAHTKIPGSIRFFDKDDKNLDFDIEKWDTLSSLKKADIWVSLPIIYGNRNDQYIKLGYGANLEDGQNKEEVFNLNYGFEGVWHLNEDIGMYVFDATSHKFSGKKLSETDPVAVDQIIGNGQEFDGANDWIDLKQEKDFMTNMPYVLISAWVYLKSFNCYILHISDSSGLNTRVFMSIDNSGKIVVGGNTSDNPQAAENKVTATEPLELNEWYNICAQIDYGKDIISIFINGDSVMTTGTIQFDKVHQIYTNSKFASIGSDFSGNNGFAKCIIDELRIFRGNRTASWIKLNYETQRKSSLFFK